MAHVAIHPRYWTAPFGEILLDKEFKLLLKSGTNDSGLSMHLMNLVDQKYFDCQIHPLHPIFAILLPGI